MKKLFALAAVVLIAASVTSCKKNYTCKCTYTGTGMDPVYYSATINGTKSDAKSACNGVGTTYIAGNTSFSASCAIE